MKCLFHSWHDCHGKLEEKEYKKPFSSFDYWHFPIVYTCEFHRDREVTWRDALNSRSNVLVGNKKMTHTTELSTLQGFEFWVGNCEEIEFCEVCKGTGEIGYSEDLRLSKGCTECNCTGRKNK